MPVYFTTCACPQLLVAHRSLKEEIESSRQTAVDAVERERKASRMMAKLTAMVKEQKNRITELHTDKAESDKELKGMVAELEMELGTKGKLESKLEFTELVVHSTMLTTGVALTVVSGYSAGEHQAQVTDPGTDISHRRSA
jgi:septal ring factor EnvC (AmiA/AmiB activator)